MTSLPKGVYVQRYVHADGTTTTYYRWRATGKRIRGEPGTPEFETSLAAAKVQAHVGKAGTWEALVRDYKLSPRYRRDLAPSTRAYYDRHIERMRAFNSKMVADIGRRDILTIRDALAVDTPQSANLFVMTMSVLMEFAVDREYREVNPLARIKRIKGGSYRPWSDAQIRHALSRFEEPYRRAVLLALHTGQRLGDCITMTWAQYDGSAIEVCQEKTKAHLWIPAHRTLKAALDSWRVDAPGGTILLSSLERPWSSAHSFAARMARVIGEHVELRGLVFHGLRKAAAVRLAEAGCSAHEIMSITGHKSLSMVELYTKGVTQKKQARAAMTRLELVDC